ncbi:MAG: HAMP domain-containing histidine kinase [Deltaproteobacteria bacterium]|nr:HAMP domain-containing histidine kinase [Deltaproteobacteria bacterium]
MLVTALVAALLAAWGFSGWSDVRARQQAALGAPVHAADERAADLARELRGNLDGLLAREGDRPYFHYQNLFHDPRASEGNSVAPSPLAAGPGDPLVLGYFQIDAKDQVTTPTLNDEVPSLSEPTHVAEHKAFRDAVARELSAALAPTSGPTVAIHEHHTAAPVQHVEVSANAYAQNLNGNYIYENNAMPTPPKPPSTTTHTTTTIVQSDTVRVTVAVSALEWRTLPFQGAPALVAVRDVGTPDGAFAQGFVVDRTTVTSWLAAHAGDMVATLAQGTGRTEIAPGWLLTIAPNPRALAAAAVEAHAIEHGFIVRFALVGSAAVLLAALIVLLVARAEQLARERSQFAASAAHELRTPLAGLQLYGDMLADGLGDPDKARDYARRMAEEAARLGRVVSNVLGFSQLERGNLSVDAQLAPLTDTLRDLADRAQPALDRAGAALALDTPPDLRARFDRDALTRIVGNLLDNAEKYTRGIDDRTIDLTARDCGDRVEVVVADHGPGVREPDALFKPFARGVGADAPAGLGLGLALSRSLARAMGGELRYRTGDGGGAAFVLELPRA